MEQYYLRQAGDGLPLQSFSGLRYQRGHGFFGRFIAGTVLPLLRYLGNQAVETGEGFLEDTEQSASNRILETANKIAEDVIKHKKTKMEGNGLKVIKRKRVKAKKHNKDKNLYDFLK